MDSLPIAVRFLGPASRGSSLPGFFQCDNGQEYLIKFNAPSMNRLLFNEYIVYHLAETLGLPIPKGEIIDIHPFLWNNERFLAGRNISKVFGFEKIVIVDNINSDNSFKMSWPKFIKGAKNKNLIPDILVFDMWISNCDRAGLGNNYGNLVMNNKGELNIIDHSHALGGVRDTQERTNNLTDPLNCQFFTEGPIPSSLASQIYPDGSKNPFQSIISRINSIGFSDIQAIVNTAANFWGINTAESVLVAEFLEKRKPLLQQYIDYLVYPKGYFINWEGRPLIWI